VLRCGGVYAAVGGAGSGGGAGAAVGVFRDRADGDRPVRRGGGGVERGSGEGGVGGAGARGGGGGGGGRGAPRVGGRGGAGAGGEGERGVRAAVDLVAGVADLGADAEVPGLAARAGVVTGEVAVTLGATHEGMVAGDAVNTAARVQAAADPGTVLTDGATQRLAGGGVGFADAGEHTLKGKAEPQHLWRGARGAGGGGGGPRGGGAGGPP